MEAIDDDAASDVKPASTGLLAAAPSWLCSAAVPSPAPLKLDPAADPNRFIVAALNATAPAAASSDSLYIRAMSVNAVPALISSS